VHQLRQVVDQSMQAIEANIGRIPVQRHQHGLHVRVIWFRFRSHADLLRRDGHIHDVSPMSLIQIRRSMTARRWCVA
jgi:hypothetical protein